MTSTFVWKPSTVSSWKGGPVLLTPDTGSKDSPTITVNGKVYKGRFVNTNEGHNQFVFPKELIGFSNLQVESNGQKGVIDQGSTSFEGSDLSKWQARQKGSLGSGFTGNPAFQPGQIGFGAYPADLTKYFPAPGFMDAAKLAFTDPEAFAKKYSPFLNDQFSKNFDAAKDLGLKTLDTELQGLQAFAPAAAALKRNETSIDNQFNQAQRTQQVQSTLPDVAANLKTQTSQAASYMAGRAPDEVTDRALELTSRGASADRSQSGGFGASSSVARKASDLMSADERIKLSQYGNQLTTQNTQSRQALELAPTEYSNAGQQINTMPSVSAGQTTASIASQLNQFSLLPTSTAFQSQVQQNEFQANFQQQANVNNQAAQNQFSLAKFGYQAGLAGAIAGASQTNINTEQAIQQQQQYLQTMQQFMQLQQSAATLQSAFQGISTLISSFGGLDKLTSSITSLFSGGIGSGGSDGVSLMDPNSILHFNTLGDSFASSATSAIDSLKFW